MADQHSSHPLSPQLRAVLGSLNVNLETELNRYRRNRGTHSLSNDENIFSDLEDPSFELDMIEAALTAPSAPATPLQTAEAGTQATPPPLPPNKKLQQAPQATAGPESPAERSEPAGEQTSPEVATALTVSHLAGQDTQTVHQPLSESPIHSATASAAAGRSTPPIPSSHLVSSIVKASPSEAGLSSAAKATSPGGGASGSDRLDAQLTASPEGYLASSEKLIESLAEIPDLPDPVETAAQKPKRKTVSLLAGASLGLLGLVAGLGASYLMANPRVAQTLAEGWQPKEESAAEAPSASNFDPPGPDLSANEFIDLKIDNLSSLNMPQTGVNPELATPPVTPAPAIPSNTTAPNPAPTPQASVPTPTSPNPQSSTATQAAVIPAGVTYYVTVPFTTEKGLSDIRQTVNEAFVRQFANGNHIQLAAFDNPTSAQQFLGEIKAQGITGQIYGPTTE